MIAIPDDWWTHRTWNPVTGRRAVVLHHKRLGDPYGWRNMSRVLVCPKSDLFADAVPDGFIAWAWMAMAKNGQHEFRVPTRNPDRMCAFVERWNDLSGESCEPKLVRGPDATRAAHPSGRGQLFAAYLDELGSTVPPGQPIPGAWPTFDWMEGPRWWTRLPLWNVRIEVTA